MTTSVSVFGTALGDNDESRLQAYLYSHTELVAKTTAGRLTLYVLRTTAGTLDEAQRLNLYQMARLGSGLYGTRSGLTATAASQGTQQFVSGEIERVAAPKADRLGNVEAREGADRCSCGCKYWENDRCVDCGTHVREATR